MKLKLNLVLISNILLLIIFNTVNLHARETMIRKGYTSCNACHVSPNGGGHLTTYGEMVSDSLSLWKGTRAIKESKNIITHGAQVRLAHVRTEVSNSTFPMQADYLTALKWAKINVVSTLAKSPNRSSSLSEEEKPKFVKTLYFSEFKLMRKLSKNSTLTLGRERQNIGLRLEDHTIYNKSLNRFNVTDLASLVSIDKVDSKTSFNASVFFPSYQEVDSKQEYGLKTSSKFFFKKLQLGLGVLFGQTENIKRYLLNLNFKVNVSDFVLMIESNLTKRETGQNIKFNQNSYFSRLSYFPLNPIELFISGDVVRRENPFLLTQERAGAGLTIKLQANTSLRFDYKKTFFSQTNETTFISQLFFNGW